MDNTPINDEILIKYVKEYIKKNKTESTYVKQQKPKHIDNAQLEHNSDENIESNYKYLDPLPINKSIKFPGDAILGTNLGQVCGKFNEKFHRHGSIHNIEELETRNTSFYFSVLYCIKDDFNELSYEDKKICLRLFIKKIINCSASSLFERFRYKTMGWTKKNLAVDMNADEITSTIIRFIADLFHINIFFLDIEKDMLCYSGTNPCVIYKKNIILIRHPGSIFEPVTSTKNVLYHKSEFIQFISKKQHIVQLLSCNFKPTIKKKITDMNNPTEPVFFKIGKGNEDFYVFIREEIDDNETFEDITVDNIKNISYKKLLAFAENQNITTTYFRNGERRKIRKEKLLSIMRNHMLNQIIDDESKDNSKDNSKDVEDVEDVDDVDDDVEDVEDVDDVDDDVEDVEDVDDKKKKKKKSSKKSSKKSK